MKRNIQKLVLAIFALFIATPLWAETSPKREHRSAWVSTVYRLCWPTTYGTTSSVATSQKAEALNIIERMKATGFNAVYLQVRSRSDAMYKSSYEPWSSDLTGSRGSEPAWDPLEYWVAECHKRGMECYAWINPYRYESSANAWGNSDYRADHPDWIMTYNSKTILNPGMEEVQQRIVDVCKEIITNYDVDGIVFDDYFYLQGTPESYDSDLYAASGTSLSQADWRRENVNTMVRKVWNMIQSTKPYVKFGIGPAGVSDKAASDYGLSDCTGNDWQYDGLYSNPLAWLGEGTIDFITPQIYWRNSSTTNPYDPIAEWWSDACANTFGRHFYSSQDLAWLSSNNSSTYWAETAAQVQTNRDATGNDAPGCVFFDTRYFTGIGDGGVEGVAEYLYENKFQNPALPPVLTWKNNYSTDPGPVTNLALTGTTLSWTGYDNMRYAVYAVPTGTSTEGEISSDYLLGNPYETTFDVSGYTSGYTLGVSVVDRYGYEFAVTWLGGDAVIEQLATPTLTSPADGTTTAETFDFTWSAIDGATYTLEISTSATFATTNFSKTSTTNSLASSSFNLAASTTYYWRVKAAKTGYISSTSATQSFTTAADESSSTGGDTSNLTKDPATYSAVGDYTVENLWIYSSATSNFPSNLTSDTKQRSMTTLNGNIYVAQNDGYILVFNGTTGEYTKTITLTGDCKTTSSGTTLSYPSNDIFVDGAGNLCVSNLATSLSSQPLCVSTVNLSTGATTRVFESAISTSERIDYAGAYGDVTAEGGQVWAAVASDSKVYCWTRSASGSWTSQYSTIGKYYPTSASNAGAAPRVMPVSTTQFILDGHSTDPTLYTFKASSTATYNYGFDSNTALATPSTGSNGTCVATLGGNPIFLYAYGNNGVSTGFQFAVATNPSDFDFSQSEKLWVLPQGSLGSTSNSCRSSQPAILNSTDTTVTVVMYSPNNGIASYLLSYTGEIVEEPTETLSAVSLTTPANGATTTSGFDFAWSAIDGASYTIELSTNAAFSSIAFSATTTSNSYSSSNFSLADGTKYYWRVTAEKSGYISSTSSTASFTTATPDLSPVTLTAPASGTTVADSFNFSWTSIVGATYTIEVSTSSTFSTVNFSASTTATSYSSSNFALTSNTTYYWRVTAAVSGYNSSTSETSSFTTPMPTLATVTLNSPVGGVTTAQTFDFSWSGISGATYTIEISTLASFATVMFTTETTVATIASSTFSFAEGTKYYWRVKASMSGYNSSTSAVESFTTYATPTEDPEPTTGLPTDGGTYDTKSGLKIENLWIYSIMNSNFPEQLGNDQRGMAAYNGNIYICERIGGQGGTGQILEFSGKTGEYLRTIALSGDYLTLSDGNQVDYPCNDIFVDGGNNLCISNMVTKFSASGQFNVCTVDINTGVTTRVFESYLNNISIRTDHCMVYGDITKAGAKVYAAASANSNYINWGPSFIRYDYRKRIYCWTRSADHGTNDAYTYWQNPTYRDASSFYPSGSSYFGYAPRVLPIDDTRIIVDGSATLPTLYTYGSSLTMSDNFANNSSIMPSGYLSCGMCTGEVDGKSLYIYAYNDNTADMFNFAIAYNPSDFDYASMELLWTVPQNGLGQEDNSSYSSIPATIDNGDGSMTLFIYVPNNGLAAYRIANESWTSVSEIDIVPQSASIRVIDRIAYVSEQAEVIDVYSTSGAIVATASNCNTINLAALPAGVYVINAQNGDTSIVERVVIK